MGQYWIPTFGSGILGKRSPTTEGELWIQGSVVGAGVD